MGPTATSLAEKRAHHLSDHRQRRPSYGAGVSLVDSYGDLLGALEEDRQAHSLAVGRKVEAEVERVDAWLRSDLVAAAALHDLGYGHVDTGFHPLDGARQLARLGFSEVVCNLVVHQSASTLEAEERGLDLTAYRDFAIEEGPPGASRSPGS